MCQAKSYIVGRATKIGDFIQLIGAYVIFLLSIVALALGLILCWVIGEVLYEGTAWFRTHHPVVGRLRRRI
jgi:hypothetical protein